MPAFQVEDGTGLANANSYASVAAAIDQLTQHPTGATWTGLTTPQQQYALMNATAWLDEKFRWFGKSNTTTQALKWPRTKLYDGRGNLVQAGTIPPELVTATILMAMNWVNDVNLYTDIPVSGIPDSAGVAGVTVHLNPAVQETFLGRRFPEVELLVRQYGILVLPDEDLVDYKP